MITNQRQRYLLAHLDQVEIRKTFFGRRMFFLASDDYSDEIDSLVNRGVLIKLNGGTQLRPTAVGEAFLA